MKTCAKTGGKGSGGMADRLVRISRDANLTYRVSIDGVEVARGLTLAEAVAFCEEDGR